MNSKYQPRFPRSVSGDSYRTPFDAEPVEQVSKRMSLIYQQVDLSPDDRARLLRMHIRLWGAQGDIVSQTPSNFGRIREIERDLADFMTRLGLGASELGEVNDDI